MSAWAETTLKKVAEKINYGYTASATEQNTGVKFLRITDIASGAIDWDTVPYCEISETDLEKCRLTQGEIVIARTGATVGYAQQIRSNLHQSVFASYLVRVKLKDDVCRRFVGILIESNNYKYYINTIAGGSAQPNANAQDLCSYPFYLPPTYVQQKIAAILSAYDDLIENNQRRIVLLEKMAEEIYREWFVRLRFPGHDKVKLVKGVPQGWRPSCLGNVAKFTMGQSPSSEFYNEVGNGLPFHQGVGTYGERFPRTINYCSEDGRRAHKGDILFSVRAPVGRLNIADREMIIGRGLSAIRHKKEHNHYLYYLLKTAFVNEDIIGNGSIFNSVGKDELAKFPIFESEPSLVEKFDAIASKIDEQITAFIHATECLKTSRDALLPRLISGKLSVENLTIHRPNTMRDENSSHGN